MAGCEHCLLGKKTAGEKKAKQNKETSIFLFPLGNKMQSRVGDIQG